MLNPDQLFQEKVEALKDVDRGHLLTDNLRQVVQLSDHGLELPHLLGHYCILDGLKGCEVYAELQNLFEGLRVECCDDFHALCRALNHHPLQLNVLAQLHVLHFEVAKKGLALLG